MSFLHILKMLFALTLNAKMGLATSFAPTGDRFNPVAYAACLHRDLRNTDMIVAHRTLPCKSKVWVFNPRTNKSVVARIGDRGPFGKWKNGSFKAILDLAPATTKALHSNGWDQVVMIPIQD